MVFRRPPIVDLPDAADDLAADVDNMGRPIEDFADAVLREVITTGRVAVLLDHTRREEDFSQGKVGAGPPTEFRPYLSLYQTEAILDVVWEKVGGARKLVQARLAEVMEVPGESEFDTRTVEVVRVLELRTPEGSGTAVYQQRVFERHDEEVRQPSGAMQIVTSWAEREELATTPAKPDGSSFDFIPLWVIGTGAAATPGEIEPPPLLDLSDVNLCHYRQDADYRNALHMAGVPTPYALGMPKQDESILFGTAQFLWFDQATEVGFLSYGAEGVGAIRQALADLEQQMAFLGARMLQPDKRGVEAAETARIHRMGEISILARISNVISNNLTAAVRFMLEWAAILTTDDDRVRLNDDFLPTQAPAQLLAEMVKAWQEGAISHDSLWRFAQEGELVDPRRTVEEEQALIEVEVADREAQQRLARTALSVLTQPDDEEQPTDAEVEEAA